MISTPITNEKQQKMLSTLFSQQEASAKNNNNHNPSVFIFISFDHRKNLFYQDKKIDKNDASYLKDASGSVSILSLPETLRDEVCFLIKKDKNGLFFIKTGNYNEDAPDAFISILSDSLVGRSTFPYILNSSVSLNLLSSFGCGKKICEAFLDMGNLKESILKLKVLEYNYDEDGSVLLIDAKNPNEFYLVSDDILYKAKGRIEEGKVVLWSLVKISDGDNLVYEIVAEDWMNDMDITEKSIISKYDL